MQQLIGDLQRAEERCVLLEAEVREEVADEMAQVGGQGAVGWVGWVGASHGWCGVRCNNALRQRLVEQAGHARTATECAHE